MVSLDWILLGLRILATMLLYAFLGAAFYLIWRDLKATEAQVSTPAEDNSRLQILDAAPDSALRAGELLPLQPVTLLGRDPDNTIVLTDALASEKHARIRRENGRWWLEDLNSHSGTLLNNRPLSQPTTLAAGDVITIGNIHFRFVTNKT